MPAGATFCKHDGGETDSPCDMDYTQNCLTSDEDDLATTKLEGQADCSVSVQCSRDRSCIIELHSDLVFCNHSCRPTLVFDMAKLEVRVADDRPLSVGDDLTFFYPT